MIDLCEAFEEFEVESSSFEDRINTSLQNSLKDKHTTPRYPFYLKNNILEVWVSGADVIRFDGEKITFNFPTLGKIDTKKLDLSIFKNAVKSFTESEKESEVRLLREKFRVVTSEKRINKKLSEKELEIIKKYEQRQKGDWT